MEVCCRIIWNEDPWQKGQDEINELIRSKGESHGHRWRGESEKHGFVCSIWDGIPLTLYVSQREHWTIYLTYTFVSHSTN